jgi:uncharacterized protein involved in exopolysaccharide biosynthesis
MRNQLEEEISLKELIQKLMNWVLYLKFKWKIILITSVIGGLVGYIYSLVKMPVYTASLTFALEEKATGGGSGFSSIASSFGINLGGGEGGAFTGDNIIELMKSRLLIEKTLLTKSIVNKKEDFIINRYITFNKLNEKWAESPVLTNLKFDTSNRIEYTRAQDSVLGAIQNNILNEVLEVTKIDKKLSIISVKVKSEDEIFAKLFCEYLVKNVTDFYIETKVGKSRKNIQLLESRVDSVKSELDNAMFGRATFADQNIGLIRQSAALPKLKQEMRIQMLGTMYSELVKNLEFSKLALIREEPLIQIIDKPIFPLHKYSFGKIKGLMIGSFFGGILMIIYLIINKLIKSIL